MGITDSKQLQLIIEKLQDESDRACAVLSGATLEALLENLLKKSNNCNQNLLAQKKENKYYWLKF